MGLWATGYREQQKLSITKILFLKEKKFSVNNSEGLNLSSVCDFRDTQQVQKSTRVLSLPCGGRTLGMRQRESDVTSGLRALVEWIKRYLPSIVSPS